MVYFPILRIGCPSFHILGYFGYFSRYRIQYFMFFFKGTSNILFFVSIKLIEGFSTIVVCICMYAISTQKLEIYGFRKSSVMFD